MPTINIGDTKIYFEVYGSELDLSHDTLVQKPTVIALHGGPGLDHTYQTHFLKNLSDVAQVIFIDLRGNGRSHCDQPEKWNLIQWAHDIDNFCSMLDIKNPFIAGESFGGWVAMQYGVLYPSDSSGLILYNTEGYIDKSEIAEAYKAVGGEKAKSVIEKCFDNPSPETMTDFIEYCLPYCTKNPIPDYMYRHCMIRGEVSEYFTKNHVQNINLLNDLDKIKSRVLYLACTDNPEHSLNASLKTKARFNQALLDFQVFNDSGLVSIDAPEKGIKSIKEFILSILNKE